jgi:hypothetical protein
MCEIPRSNTRDERVKRGLARAARGGEQIVDARWQANGEVKNGWRYTTGGGRAGYDFALRAALAKNQLGAQLAQEVLCPNAQVDDKAEPFTGERKYVLNFAKDQIPPVATFWNLAMYDKDIFFVENDFGRYSIGSKLLRGRSLRVLVSSGTEQSWSGELCGGAPGAGERTHQAPKD